MKDEKSILRSLLSMATVAGNILFILWILYNGANEGFQGTSPEKISYISIMSLLAINTYLILRSGKI
ncbi:MAG: hypothetical protein KKD74_06925 [Bacteroidetes bacterium]|nr:hypothetical protein [Bacteroidales bacterium]MBU1009847.1 hypothetical protein [Bacteroidota bacterium]